MSTENISTEQQSPESHTLRSRVWFQQIGQRKLATTQDPSAAVQESKPRVPRLATLMALVIRYDQLLRSGHIRDFAELSRLGEVTQARITQIMNLRLLAPDLQEAILFLPETTSPIDPISERALRPIVAEPDWKRQRAMWRELADSRL